MSASDILLAQVEPQLSTLEAETGGIPIYPSVIGQANAWALISARVDAVLAANDPRNRPLASAILGPLQPAIKAFLAPLTGSTITPSDSTDLGTPATWVYATGAGTVAYQVPGSGASGLSQTFAAGQAMRLDASRILATGTTATGLLGLP